METKHSTRDWVYAGLSVPRRTVVARKPRTQRLKPGDRVLVLGDEHAGAIGQFLGGFSVDAKVNLRFEWERGQAFERWLSASRIEKALIYRPALVVVVMGTSLTEPDHVQSRLESVQKASEGTELRWVLPCDKSDQATSLSLALAAVGVSQFHSEEIEVHRSQTGAPSARGYAGWASAIWSWIR